MCIRDRGQAHVPIVRREQPIAADEAVIAAALRRGHERNEVVADPVPPEHRRQHLGRLDRQIRAVLGPADLGAQGDGPLLERCLLYTSRCV